MSDYWTGLVNYKQGKAHRYFRAQVDDNGEAIESTICEVNFTEERDRIKEQIQEDIRTFMLAFPDGYDDGKVKADAEYMTDSLCDIVVNNFKGFE